MLGLWWSIINFIIKYAIKIWQCFAYYKDTYDFGFDMRFMIENCENYNIWGYGNCHILVPFALVVRVRGYQCNYHWLLNSWHPRCVGTRQFLDNWAGAHPLSSDPCFLFNLHLMVKGFDSNELVIHWVGAVVYCVKSLVKINKIKATAQLKMFGDFSTTDLVTSLLNLTITKQ